MLELDFRNGVTPFALLEVVRVFKKMRPGETLEIRGNDQDLRQDLNRVLPDASFSVVADDTTGEYVACIRKTAPRTGGM
jgi:TusA-related sulfurtransferase